MANKYQVRPGFRHGKNSEFIEGDIVELTEQEYKGFKDKLKPVTPAKEAPASPQITTVDPANPGKANIPSIEAWLADKPTLVEVAKVLKAEQSGKKRQSVIDMLNAYKGE